MTLAPHKSLLIFALLGLLWTQAATAQDTTRTVLPELEPPPVEIRGRLEISFPALQRQPLVGFNPPPRVPRLPAGRSPFVETYRQSSTDLPTSPLRRPQPPSALLGASYPPAQGHVEIGLGRYYSRSVYGRISAPLSVKTALLTRLDYRGADGYRPFDTFPDIRTPYDAIEGQVGLQTAGSRWAGSIALGGFFETYDLFGATLASGNTSFPQRAQPEREGRGGTAAVRLTTLADTPLNAQVDLRYSATRYETLIALEKNTPGGEPSFTEQRVEADVDLGIPTSVGEAWADGLVSSGTLGGDFGSYTAVEGAAGLRFQAGPIQLSVGGRFLGAFSDTEQPRSSNPDALRIGYASLDVNAEFTPTPGVRLFARNRPRMEANALGDVFRTNPYLVSQPELRPTLRSIDAEVGAGLFAGPVQIVVQGGYQEMPQYLFFEQARLAETSNYDRGFTALRYAEAEVFHAGGSASLVLPGGLHAMLGATYRDGRLTDTETDIPYFAPLIGEATLSYSFLQSKGLIQVTGYFESSRYRDRQQTLKVDSYFDLDVEASYNITELIGLVFRVENIPGGSNERWDHYAASPTMIGVGARVLW